VSIGPSQGIELLQRLRRNAAAEPHAVEKHFLLNTMVGLAQHLDVLDVGRDFVGG